MSQASEAAEPTMEEILASIRRIIADDPTGGDEEKIMSGSKAATETDESDEDLAAWDADSSEDNSADNDGGVELSQDDLDSLFDDEDVADDPEDASDDGSDLVASGDQSDSEDDDDDAFGFETEPEAEPDDEELDVEFAADDDTEPEPEPEPDDDVFELSEDLAVVETAPTPEGLISMSAENLVAAQLGLLSNLNVPQNGPTLEHLVKELLRPMMKIWLDENLPPLVEEMVRQEIDRISKGRR